jgi:hypothetical protein
MPNHSSISKDHLQPCLLNVGRNLLIFSMKTKIEKMSKIILKQHCWIRSLPVRRQWKYKRKDLIVKPGFYFILFLYLELRLYFLYLLGLYLLYLFIFLIMIKFIFTARIRFTIAFKIMITFSTNIYLL